MNGKLLKLLQDGTKDFGLTELAIKGIAEQFSDGLTDETSDDVISAKAKVAIALAKQMQGEITRKSQKSSAEIEALKKELEELKKNPDDKGSSSNEEPDWFKAYKEQQEAQLKELKAQNDAFKAGQAKAERSAKIAAKAKELQIPEFMMEMISIKDDDEDYEKTLTNFKQKLIENSLGGTQHDTPAQKEAQMRDISKSIVDSLPSLN